MAAQKPLCSPSTGRGSSKLGTPSRSTKTLPETLVELRAWARLDRYWSSVLGQADRALEGYPARMQFSFPKKAHPLIFTADCIHAMALLAPERGVDLNLTEVIRGHFFSGRR